MVLYVTHYPRRVFYFWGVLPVPVWVLCLLYLLQDLAGFGGALEGNGENVAYEVHLSGALFAFIYRRTGWNLGRLVPQRWSGWRFPSRARLKVHQPPVEVEEEKDISRKEENLNRRVDEILAKISSTGEASLTREERRILEDASRRYQQRRR